ncbi:MAG TPA: 6-phosphofructokinase [Dehalococcoidia bacterium]|nr:6-phosphofructokinase [Dehalococcoidia bacterium]
MKRIGVLTSGGDAPGMNACIRAIVRCGVSHKLEVVGIRRGYCGIFEEDFIKLGSRSVSNIIHRGGTILETARCEEMKSREGMRTAIEILQREGIEGLITIGGDGTLRGATKLAKAGGVKIISVPSTIDNDVYGTDYTIGFDTAINTALDAIDKIRDTAGSLPRPFFVEVMGRSRGFIALEVGIAGGAEDIMIPEVETKIEEISLDIKRSFERGKKSFIVIVAEGDEAGGAFSIAQQVWERLKLEYRVCVLGHVQRGGSPTAKDRVLASKLGAAAVDALVRGMSGYMVGELKGELAFTPLRETWDKKKELDSNLLQLVKVLAG